MRGKNNRKTTEGELNLIPHCGMRYSAAGDPPPASRDAPGPHYAADATTDKDIEVLQGQPDRHLTASNPLIATASVQIPQVLPLSARSPPNCMPYIPMLRTARLPRMTMDASRLRAVFNTHCLLRSITTFHHNVHQINPF